MFEVESNYGSKANHLLVRNYSVALTREGAVLHHKITLDFINRTPFGTPTGWNYHADVRLFVGPSASSISTTLTSVVYANPPPPRGVIAINGWLLVECCGSRGQAVIEYNTPWPTTEKAPYQIYWQKQPGTLSDSVTVTWNDGHGHTSTSTGDLAQDRLITLASTGVTLTPGKAANAGLPSLRLG
jgi:hypothetical protein